MQRAIAIVAMGLWASVAVAATEWKAPASARATKNLVEKAGGVKVGQSLFQENCVICHGKTGKGDGEATAALNPKPKSLISQAVQA